MLKILSVFIKVEAADFFYYYYFKHFEVNSCFYYLQYKICNTLFDFSSWKISMNIKLMNLLCNSVAQFIPYFQPRDHIRCAVPVKSASKLMLSAILINKTLMFIESNSCDVFTQFCVLKLRHTDEVYWTVMHFTIPYAGVQYQLS
jgi:hypothetical protein